MSSAKVQPSPVSSREIQIRWFRDQISDNTLKIHKGFPPFTKDIFMNYKELREI